MKHPMKSTAAALGLLLAASPGAPAADPTNIAVPNPAPARQPAARRATLLAALPSEPGWQDMAFLAAVPAACRANGGAPSLVALDASGTLSPEIEDYLRRYRPDAVCRIGVSAEGAVVGGRHCEAMPAASADEAACRLSAKYWHECAMAVICAQDDYAAGLVAAPLAARLHAPLLFTAAQGLTPQTTQELQRLKARELIAIGTPAAALPSLKQLTPHVTTLAGATEVMAWVSGRGLKVSYLAALNPLDRSHAVIKKVSLAGALLAAGRDGLVAPLAYEVQWKIPFSGVEMKRDMPDDLPASAMTPRTGIIAVGWPEHQFVLTGGSGNRGLRAQVTWPD